MSRAWLSALLARTALILAAQACAPERRLVATVPELPAQLRACALTPLAQVLDADGVVLAEARGAARSQDALGSDALLLTVDRGARASRLVLSELGACEQVAALAEGAIAGGSERVDLPSWASVAPSCPRDPFASTGTVAAIFLGCPSSVCTVDLEPRACRLDLSVRVGMSACGIGASSVLRVQPSGGLTIEGQCTRADVKSPPPLPSGRSSTIGVAVELTGCGSTCPATVEAPGGAPFADLVGTTTPDCRGQPATMVSQPLWVPGRGAVLSAYAPPCAVFGLLRSDGRFEKLSDLELRPAALLAVRSATEGVQVAGSRWIDTTKKRFLIRDLDRGTERFLRDFDVEDGDDVEVQGLVEEDGVMAVAVTRTLGGFWHGGELLGLEIAATASAARVRYDLRIERTTWVVPGLDAGRFYLIRGRDRQGAGVVYSIDERILASGDVVASSSSIELADQPLLLADPMRGRMIVAADGRIGTCEGSACSTDLPAWTSGYYSGLLTTDGRWLLAAERAGIVVVHRALDLSRVPGAAFTSHPPRGNDDFASLVLDDEGQLMVARLIRGVVERWRLRL